MAEAQTSTTELIAGRYRPLQIVHREEFRVGWHGQDMASGRLVFLAEARLPAILREETSGQTTARVLRETANLEASAPGRVATVLDVTEQDGRLWTVMEPIDGQSLSELLDLSGPFNQPRVVRIGLEILDVLAAAHRLGVIHGDLGPDQVFVKTDGSVVVTGFGLSGADRSLRANAPSYASPEQIRGEAIDPSTDLWALGALLHTMVEGRPPASNPGYVEGVSFSPEGIVGDRTRGEADRSWTGELSTGRLRQTIHGLLREDPRERLTEPVLRRALARMVSEDSAEPPHVFGLRGIYGTVPGAERMWRRKRPIILAIACSVLAVVAVPVVLTVNSGSASDASDAAGPAATASGSAAAPVPAPPTQVRPSADPTGGASSGTSDPAVPAVPSSSVSAEATAPPATKRYVAPEGFSVELPSGWRRLKDTGRPDNAFSVTFGASGDPRTLRITFGSVASSDPVTVWRIAEPQLRRLNPGFDRIGDIQRVDQPGGRAADLEWFAKGDTARTRTLARALLVDTNLGYSIRWTTPAADWNAPANQQTLDTILNSFRATR
ncbi:serine/threonine-protein kinase [Streptomyces sp. NBC_00878]|uniref:serine/threonine protein kinase n=1 Tax=Streptomyces sp. NBC_00878 TaxID=2975854 RepID=UPI002257AFD6|nr:serine/threonine-protein kinase [Streptomyces sp. NBC_00878]MCX4902882.1 serine/threonine protein kinase [Streptomyces sp. NBC_00878]